MKLWKEKIYRWFWNYSGSVAY